MELVWLEDSVTSFNLENQLSYSRYKIITCLYTKSLTTPVSLNTVSYVLFSSLITTDFAEILTHYRFTLDNVYHIQKL